MPTQMEGDVLFNFSSLQPFVHYFLSHIVKQSFEYLSCSFSTHQMQCVIINGDNILFRCFLQPENQDTYFRQHILSPSPKSMHSHR